VTGFVVLGLADVDSRIADLQVVQTQFTAFQIVVHRHATVLLVPVHKDWALGDNKLKVFIITSKI